MASADLINIVSYIAQENPTAAYEVLDAIEQQVDGLGKHPKMGRVGRIKGTREFVISRLPYVVPYRIVDAEVEVLRVVHTSRLWPTCLTDLLAEEL